MDIQTGNLNMEPIKVTTPNLGSAWFFLVVLPLMIFGFSALNFYSNDITGGIVLFLPAAWITFFAARLLLSTKTVTLTAQSVDVKYKFRPEKNYTENLEGISGYIFGEDGKVYASTGMAGVGASFKRTILLKFRDAKILRITTGSDWVLMGNMAAILKERGIRDYSIPNQRATPLFGWNEITKQFNS